MPYTALPDRRIPYDNDGTVVGVNADGTAYTTGIAAYESNATLIEWQDSDAVAAGQRHSTYDDDREWFFFPEQREITGLAMSCDGGTSTGLPGAMQGSNDTTNGLDGTWEEASFASGRFTASNAYSWREGIKPVSFTGGKRVIRLRSNNAANNFGNRYVTYIHLYGEKTAGQTPDDLIYIDHDTTPGIEYTAPEDFGDQPLGTTVVRQFRLKNTSATKTANTINVQCNDADFAISTDGTTWVVTISIASLGPGAQSATMYVRCTTPAPGNLLGPRFARIVTTVASYT